MVAGFDEKLSKNAKKAGLKVGDEILKVDEKKRVVYFTGMGREEGENPYYQHLYSVSLDGGEVKKLDEGNFSTLRWWMMRVATLWITTHV